MYLQPLFLCVYLTKEMYSLCETITRIVKIIDPLTYMNENDYPISKTYAIDLLTVYVYHSVEMLPSYSICRFSRLLFQENK